MDAQRCTERVSMIARRVPPCKLSRRPTDPVSGEPCSKPGAAASPTLDAEDYVRGIASSGDRDVFEGLRSGVPLEG